MILINSSPKNALKIFQPFLPISVPIGLACLLAAFEREKIDIQFVDEQIEDDVLAKIAQYVKAIEPPYIFGFSVLTVALSSALRLAETLKKKYPGSIVVFGGIHPSAMAQEVLSFAPVDLVVRGEGEKPLIALYKAIKAKTDYFSIPGLSYRDGAKLIHNPCQPIVDDLDNYPRFPYHRFAHRAYDLGFVVTSRGCPYQCIFCSNRITTGRQYRYRSAGPIVEELELLHDQYGKRSVVFMDDNFLVSKERIYGLIEAIKGKGLDKTMTFTFQARGDNVDRKILADLYAAGFRNVFFGLETSSETVMKTIKKGETVAQCVEAVRMAKAIGFLVSATFVYGFPGETRADRMNCVKLSRELDLDMVRFNNATPYPGTELYDIAVKEGRLHVQGLYENFVSVSTFVENPFRKTPFSYVPQGSTESEIRRDLLFSYFSFYLNIRRLKRIFAKPESNVGWFNAGNSLLAVLAKIPALLVLAVMGAVKFCQLFYYMTIKKETRTCVSDFCKVFAGLSKRPGL